jgi:hypothetical protein
MNGKCLQTFTHMGSAAAFTVAPKGGTQSQPGRAPDGGCHPPGEGTRCSSSMLEVLAVHRPPMTLIRNRLNALRITARLLPLITFADVAVSPGLCQRGPHRLAWRRRGLSSPVACNGRYVMCGISLSSATQEQAHNGTDSQHRNEQSDNDADLAPTAREPRRRDCISSTYSSASRWDRRRHVSQARPMPLGGPGHIYASSTAVTVPTWLDAHLGTRGDAGSGVPARHMPELASGAEFGLGRGMRVGSSTLIGRLRVRVTGSGCLRSGRG